jgi:hypothetical protein
MGHRRDHCILWNVEPHGERHQYAAERRVLCTGPLNTFTMRPIWKSHPSVRRRKASDGRGGQGMVGDGSFRPC